MNVEGIIAALLHVHLRGLPFSCTEGLLSNNQRHESCVLGVVTIIW